MAVTSYHTVDGQILGQTKDGVRTQYLTDALGSVTTTVNDAGVVQNTYRYKPYGGTLAKTGVAADPRFIWAGAWGYRANISIVPTHYVRTRHYDTMFGGWLSLDPLWPDWSAYSYANSAPTGMIDPSGLAPCPPPKEQCCCCPIDPQPTKHKKIRVPPGGFPRSFTNLQKSQWYGFEVTFRFKLKFFKKPNPSGACYPEDHEDVKFNGKPWKGVPFWNSSLAEDWKACLIVAPTECDGTSDCMIRDYPGATNVNMLDRLTDMDLILHKVLKIHGGKDCGCGELRFVFDMHISWTSRHLGKPDIWEPSDN